MRKAWNVRDQTTKALEILLERKYKEIDKSYKKLKKISNFEESIKIVKEIWEIKSFANSIELELMRRENNNGIS